MNIRRLTARPLRTTALALALGLAAPLAMASSATAAPAATQRASADIIDTAVAAGQFSTLAAAIQAAGLVDTLKGAGPFTVFAPTDAAFAALPAGTVENLLKPENKDQLVAVLTHHVVPGKVTAAQVTGLDKADTVNGTSLRISAANGAVMIDNARVTSANVMASNGVIHVIDKVLLPSK